MPEQPLVFPQHCDQDGSVSADDLPGREVGLQFLRVELVAVVPRQLRHERREDRHLVQTRLELHVVFGGEQLHGAVGQRVPVSSAVAQVVELQAGHQPRQRRDTQVGTEQPLELWLVYGVGAGFRAVHPKRRRERLLQADLREGGSGRSGFGSGVHRASFQGAQSVGTGGRRWRRLKTRCAGRGVMTDAGRAGQFRCLSSGYQRR